MHPMVTERAAAENKLVSIICRTVARPQLQHALESVANQTYSNLEIILVDAAAKGDLPFLDSAGSIPVTLVSSGAPMQRSKAANAGLDSASGHFILFLDDDDWLGPHHVANLVQFFALQSDARAVYSSIRKTDVNGNPLETVFDHGFDAALLRRDNFIPIHAVLFEASLLKNGCRFDESLDIYEDWDFWLQVSLHTRLVHLNEITAYYRDGGASETSVEIEQLKYTPNHPNAIAREKVFAKWLTSWSASDVNQMLGSMDQSEAINELRSEIVKSHSALDERHQELAKAHGLINAREQELAVMRARYQQLQASHELLQTQHEELDRGVREILNSFSWRITRPYRFLRRRVSDYLVNPLFNPLKPHIARVLLKVPVLHNLVQNTQSKVQSVTRGESVEESIYFGLDSPSEGNNLFSDSLMLQGWALALKGSVKLTAFIDDLEYRPFTPSYARPDVARIYTTQSSAENCGFFEKISLRFLHSGKHRLTLEVANSSGQIKRIQSVFYLFKGNELYAAWLNYQTQQSKHANRARVATKAAMIHILFVDDAPGDAAVASLCSVVAQNWSNWQLHYIGSNWDPIKHRLDELKQPIPDLKISINSDLATALAKIDDKNTYVLGLAPGETLLPHCLTELSTLAQQLGSDLVYADHDHVIGELAPSSDAGVNSDKTGEHCDPIFTPQWSPDRLLSRNYIGDVFLARSTLTAQLPPILNPAWRYRWLLDIGNNSSVKIDRVAKILWSEPVPDQPQSQLRDTSENRAIEDYLSQQKIPAELSITGKGRYLNWQLKAEPMVSIIIPTTGNLRLLRPCLNSIVEKTDYKNYEIIMLDNSRGKNPDGIDYLNQQNLKIVECDEEFNWARLNNIGARHASGEMLLFLNDDIEVTDGGWLLELVKLAARADIGAVGCLLYYPNGAIQHAGVFLVNYGGGGLHLFHKMMPDENIYLRMDQLVREVSANTGACLMVGKDKYQKLGGFDEELAVVGNDVDFCLRLLKSGLRNLWTPYCELIHHESISRKAIVPKEDEIALWERWRETFESGDKFYNPNLTLEKWDCSLRLDVPVADLIREFKSEPDAQDRLDSQTLNEGVNLIAYIRAEMGLGEGARSDARALTAAGIDFGIINFESGNPGRMADFSWKHKEILNAPFDINLMHINADFLPLAKQELPKHFFKNRYNIGYWAWELEEIPQDWLPALREVDEVWVPSDFVKVALEKVTTLPVITIPHCVQIVPDRSLRRDYFSIPQDGFVFLAMFDSRSIAARKNPYGAIEAFKLAFDANDHKVCLMLKVNNMFDEDRAALNACIESYHNIRVLEQTHTRTEINSLLGLVDCYVSLHRSEGFGLVPAEAMSLAKPCIITNWSGTTDYMRADNCKAVDYELVTITEDAGPYKSGNRWAEPDVKQAAHFMKELADNPDQAKLLGENARKTIVESFSPDAVGKAISARLQQIRKIQNPD